LVKPVTQLHRNTDKDLTDVTVTRVAEKKSTSRSLGKVAAAVVGLAAAVVLQTTAHHPFWDETTDTWVNASELTVGHELRTVDGDKVIVTKVDNHTGAKEMRDLTVADTHTYYVAAGDEQVLVHNNSGCKKTAVFGVHEESERLASDLRGANPGRIYETYNDPKLARVAPGEFRPQWMNRVSDAVNDSDGYDIAISIDGLGRYGSNHAEILQNAIKEGGRLDGRGLPLNCATCWELRQVARAVAGGGRSSSSVSFFSGGAKLDLNPFD
jgi:hypothetical protein